MILRRMNLKEGLLESAWVRKPLDRGFWSLEYSIVVDDGGTQCVFVDSCCLQTFTRIQADSYKQ